MNSSIDSFNLSEKTRNAKILFIHNTIVWYRVPFFNLLNSLFDVKFIFTFLRASNTLYGVDFQRFLNKLDHADVSISKGYLSNLVSEGIPFSLIKYLFFTKYDVVVDNLQSMKVILSYLASKIRRKPLMVWLEGWYFPNSSVVDKTKLLIAKSILSGSDAIVVPGTKHQEFVTTLGIEHQKIFIMPNASTIDQKISAEDKEKLRKRYNISHKKIVLYVGRLVRRKGVHYLIRAFSRLREKNHDVVLFIIGTGPCKNNLMNLAQDLSIKDSVFFLDHIKNEDLPSYYSASAVSIIPSINYKTNEPWGLVLNEAMQFETPVIATEAVGAAYDLIKNGENGFIIPERNETALYKSMKKVIENKKLRTKMGKESKIIIESQFQYINMVDGFTSALEYIINKLM